LREHHDEFVARDAQVLAIAPSGPGNSVGKYIDKTGAFPFPLLTDAKHKPSIDTTSSRRSPRSVNGRHCS
jgi:peroxiredoxin